MSDILDGLEAEIVERYISLLADVIAHRSRYADSAGFGQGLQPGRHIDGIAENIAVLHDDIAHVDPDAKAQTLCFRRVHVFPGNRGLDLNIEASSRSGSDETNVSPGRLTRPEPRSDPNRVRRASVQSGTAFLGSEARQDALRSSIWTACAAAQSARFCGR